MGNGPNQAERFADQFVAYLFDEYKGARHVCRVASWIGFIITAIERIAGPTLAHNRTRQVTFEYRGHRFKARYHHESGPRGGIQIVEVLPGRGAPEGRVAVEITSLSEAELAYTTLARQLNEFIDR